MLREPAVCVLLHPLGGTRHTLTVGSLSAGVADTPSTLGILANSITTSERELHCAIPLSVKPTV